MGSLNDAIEAYNKKFSDGFPSIPLCWENPPERIVEMINPCIKANKDVYQMGFLEYPDDGALY